MSSEDNSEYQDDSNQQIAISKEEYKRYQAYQKQKEINFLREQQQGLHRNSIANQQNNINNIGKNNTFQTQIPLRHQIPNHIPTQFINHPQPSGTSVNNIMNRSYNRDNSQNIMNERLYRENITRNYDRQLLPKVQVNRPQHTENSFPNNVNNTTSNLQNNSNSLLGKIKNINQKKNNVKQNNIQQNNTSSSSIQINKEILEKIDPFNLMSKEKLSIPQLKQKYKKLSLIHHPDRGGSIDNFNTLHQAIKNIDKLIKFHTQKQTHTSLKNNFKQDLEREQKTSNINLGKKFSIKKFNSVYEQNRIRTRDDEGYGSLMDKRKIDRDDITIKPMGNGKITKESFNSNFNNYKQKILGDVEVHTDSLPEPTNLNRELLYKTLGETKKNFTNIKEGYMDFKQAHIDNTLMNTNIKIKKYKNVKELERARASNMTLTKEDERLIQLEEQKRKEEELYRKKTLLENDNLMYERFKQANRMLLG